MNRIDWNRMILTVLALLTYGYVVRMAPAWACPCTFPLLIALGIVWDKVL